MMSFFKNLFGGAPKQQDLNPNKGLEQLEEKADMLRKRIAHIQEQIIEQEKLARQYASTNKTRALGALKKKKQLEENLKMAEGTLDNIENQKDMLENASSNAAVLKTMAETAKIVKQQHNNLDINKVEEIVDEIREQKEIGEEVAKVLSDGIGNKYDEDALVKELESMQQEELDTKLLDNIKVPQELPAQPAGASAEPTRKKEEEEKELDELKKWAATAQ